MFQLDIYRFCESRKSFNRQELAQFVLDHRECQRLSKSAGVTPSQFAACVAREFTARMCSLGYLDMMKGVAWVRSTLKRPFGFELESLDAVNSNYIRRMVNVGKMNDEQIFGRC